MLNCHEVTRLVSESKERPLLLKEKMALKMHTMMCSGCRNFEKQIDMIRQTSHAFAKGADEKKE